MNLTQTIKESLLLPPTGRDYKKAVDAMKEFIRVRCNEMGQQGEPPTVKSAGLVREYMRLLMCAHEADPRYLCEVYGVPLFTGDFVDAGAPTDIRHTLWDRYVLLLRLGAWQHRSVLRDDAIGTVFNILAHLLQTEMSAGRLEDFVNTMGRVPHENVLALEPFINRLLERLVQHN